MQVYTRRTGSRRGWGLVRLRVARDAPCAPKSARPALFSRKRQFEDKSVRVRVNSDAFLRLFLLFGRAMWQLFGSHIIRFRKKYIVKISSPHLLPHIIFLPSLKSSVLI